MAKEPNRVGGVLKPLDDYPDHAKLIGLIITDLTSAEAALALIFWELIGDPIRADAVFWTLGSAKARSDVVRASITETMDKSDRLRDDLLAAIVNFRKLTDKRNDIAHGEWGAPAQGGRHPFLSLKQPATKSPIFQRIYTLDALIELDRKIRECERKFNNLWQALQYRKGGLTYERLEAERKINPIVDAFLRKYE
ncbi:MAG: hypothetical protein AB7F96_02605 [Beijerinckiaceae bacterium]